MSELHRQDFLMWGAEASKSLLGFWKADKKGGAMNGVSRTGKWHKEGSDESLKGSLIFSHEKFLPLWL